MFSDESPTLGAVVSVATSDVVGGALPSGNPVLVKDSSIELPCEVGPALVGTEFGEDVLLLDSKIISDIVLLVGSCGIELCIPGIDSLELVSAAVPPWKLLGVVVDVGTPPPDVLPDTTPPVPILLPLVISLDEVATIIVVAWSDSLPEVTSPSCDLVLDVGLSACGAVDVDRADDDNVSSETLEASLSTTRVLEEGSDMVLDLVSV